MSYQIYYDRAYIRVGEKYIPLACSGSNNCFEYGMSGRYCCEKNWNALNWHRPGRFLFTEQEIHEIAHEYDEYNSESGMMFKSRNRCFKPGEIGRWIVNGMKHAYTIEEYVLFGNGFYVYDYSYSEMKDWKQYPFKTTTDLLHLLEELRGKNSLEIKLEDNREVYRPKAKRAPRSKLRTEGLSEYFVLKGEYEGEHIYFIGLNRKGGFRYYYNPSYQVKPFLSKKDAERYLKKYHGLLVDQYHFAPERIIKSA